LQPSYGKCCSLSHEKAESIKRLKKSIYSKSTNKIEISTVTNSNTSAESVLNLKNDVTAMAEFVEMYDIISSETIKVTQNAAFSYTVDVNEQKKEKKEQEAASNHAGTH